MLLFKTAFKTVPRFNLYIHTDCIGTVLMVQKQQSADALVKIKTATSLVGVFTVSFSQYTHTPILKNNFTQECMSETVKQRFILLTPIRQNEKYAKDFCCKSALNDCLE